MVRLAAILSLSLHLIACGATRAPGPPPAPTLPDVPPIRVRVYPRIGIPPIDRVNIQILIVRHPDNRKYCLEVDGPHLYSSSCENLSGMTAPFLYPRYVLGLAQAGKYTVTATLYRAPDVEKPYRVASDVVYAGTMSLAGIAD